MSMSTTGTFLAPSLPSLGRYVSGSSNQPPTQQHPTPSQSSTAPPSTPLPTTPSASATSPRSPQALHRTSTPQSQSQHTSSRSRPQHPRSYQTPSRSPSQHPYSSQTTLRHALLLEPWDGTAQGLLWRGLRCCGCWRVRWRRWGRNRDSWARRRLGWMLSRSEGGALSRWDGREGWFRILSLGRWRVWSVRGC